MKVYTTSRVDDVSRFDVKYKGSGQPVPAYTCPTQPLTEVRSTLKHRGSAAILSTATGLIAYTPYDDSIPQLFYMSDSPTEKLEDFVKEFDVTLQPEKSNVQKGREAKRWRESRRNDDVVINPVEQLRATVRVTPKPSSSTESRGLSVHVASTTQCPGDPIAGNQNFYPGLDGNSYRGLRTSEDIFGPRIAGIAIRGGVVSPLSQNYTQLWAEELCRELLEAIKMQSRIDTRLTTQVLATTNTRGVDLIANLGEVPETLKMIMDMVKGARNLKKAVAAQVKHLDVKGGLRKQLIRKARRNRLVRSGNTQAIAASERNSMKLLDSAASLWMGYRYGAQPVGLTIRQIMESMTDKLRHFQTDRSGFREEETMRFRDMDIPVEQIHRVWNRRRYDLNRHLLHQSFYLDLPSAAWELLPLSFVTDWFLNVGDVLNACGYPDVDFKDTSSYSWKTTGVFGIDTTTAYVEIKFEAYVLRPISLAGLTSLHFDPSVGIKRLLDASALSWFAFRSKTGLGDRIV